MAYISSNYEYILFVCASAVISSECEIHKKKDAFSFQYTMYISLTAKRYCRRINLKWRNLNEIIIWDLILYQIIPNLFNYIFFVSNIMHLK